MKPTRSYRLGFGQPEAKPRPDRTATHKVPSGLGGVFPVEVLRYEGDIAVVRIHSPGTEWHHWCGELRHPVTDLKEIDP